MSNASFHQKLYYVSGYVKKKPYTKKNEYYRKYPACLTYFMHFAVSYGGNSDNRHVKCVQEWPPFDHHVPSNTKGKQASRQNNGIDKNFCMIHVNNQK